MTTIKILLLAAIALFALLALRGSRKAIHKVLWRGYVLVVVVAAILSVLFPDSLTSIANVVGVGRGADLLLYVLVVTFLLVSVVMFRRLGELERRFTALARSSAISRAMVDESADVPIDTDD